MTVEDLERLFERFQTSGRVDKEKTRTVGMYTNHANITNNQELFNIVDQIDSLVYLSERSGFKYGFITAVQLILNQQKAKSFSVVSIKEYLKEQDWLQQ